MAAEAGLDHDGEPSQFWMAEGSVGWSNEPSNRNTMRPQENLCRNTFEEPRYFPPKRTRAPSERSLSELESAGVVLTMVNVGSTS